jgi:hypothetical protein
MDITVLVSVFKASKYIKHKLENLREQTIFDKLHIILLNCQNLECERSIYSSFLSYKNVTELYFNDYVKLYKSWNDGIKISKCKYISNSNADDLIAPTYYEKCVHTLDNSDFSMVSSKVLVSNVYPQQWPNWVHISDIPICYPGSTMGPCPTWRRILHDKYGYFGEYYVIGDARFWEAMHAGNEKFGVIDEHLVLYYHNAMSLERRVDESGNKLLDVDLSN